MENLYCDEMERKMDKIMGIKDEKINEIYVKGNGGINVIIKDEVVSNIKDEEMLKIEILKDK